MAERITDENGFEVNPIELHKQWGYLKDPDEIVLENIKMMHYESMGRGYSSWIGITMEDGRYYHMNIGGNNLQILFKGEGTL